MPSTQHATRNKPTPITAAAVPPAIKLFTYHVPRTPEISPYACNFLSPIRDLELDHV